MNCKDVKNKMYEYIDSFASLSEQEQAVFKEHLATCESCQKEYDELLGVMKMVHDLEEVELPENFNAALRTRLKQEAKQSKKEIPFYKRGRNYVAAAVITATVLVGSQVGPGLVANMGSDEASEEYAADLAGGSDGDMGFFTTSLDDKASPDMMDDIEVEAIDSGAGEVALTLNEAKSRTSNEAFAEKIMRNGSIALTVEDVELVNDNLIMFIEAQGGYIENASLGANEYIWDEVREKQIQTKYANITARVPATSFTMVLQEISSLGEVTYKNVSAQNATEQYYDVQSKVENLEAREERLRELMGQAEEMSEILEIERELYRVRNEIESYQTQLNYIDSRVTYSTLSIQLTQKKDLTSQVNPIEPGTFEQIKDKFFLSINKMIDAVLNVVIFIAGYSPIIIAVTVLGAGGYMYMRRRKKHE